MEEGVELQGISHWQGYLLLLLVQQHLLNAVVGKLRTGGLRKLE